MLEDPHVWGTLTEKNSFIFNDPDFEIFIDPDGDNHDYYEFEINALGTIWELLAGAARTAMGVPSTAAANLRRPSLSAVAR